MKLDAIDARMITVLMLRVRHSIVASVTHVKCAKRGMEYTFVRGSTAKFNGKYIDRRE